MAKNYTIQFGSGSPTLLAGLAPTFITFKSVPAGTNVTPPGITQIPTGTGLYYFTYGPTTSMAFTIDGATTGLSNDIRYLSGALDPIQAVDEQLTGVGNTLGAGQSALAIGQSLLAVGQSNLAIGVTGIGNTLLALGLSFQFGFSNIYGLIGNTTSSFGNSTTDPATVFGYLKRQQEFNEGDSNFNKTTGIWDVFNRAAASGVTTLLVEKVLTDGANTVTKSE